jgi:hypothetical protein
LFVNTAKKSKYNGKAKNLKCQKRAAGRRQKGVRGDFFANEKVFSPSLSKKCRLTKTSKKPPLALLAVGAFSLGAFF